LVTQIPSLVASSANSRVFVGHLVVAQRALDSVVPSETVERRRRAVDPDDTHPAVDLFEEATPRVTDVRIVVDVQYVGGLRPSAFITTVSERAADEAKD
jgi:hypothetical protein